MDILLNHIQARALGALIEKEITTPDYYPLSLNALVNACNQKNNREPVMNVDETGVREALERLQEHLLAGPARGADSRVSKYEHRLQEVFNLSRAETAVLCVLLLRGPQTPGELRGRTERMYRFEHLDDGDVEDAIPAIQHRPRSLAASDDADRFTRLEEELAHLRSDIAEIKEQLAQFRRQFE
jgi:uncharacterized protein YceH (UPF0502 family)